MFQSLRLLFNIQTTQIEKSYLQKFAQTHQITTQKQWEAVKINQLKKDPTGKAIIQKYKSVLAALLHLCPERRFDLSEWKKIPRNFWQEQENHSVVLEQIKVALRIENQNEWYSVSPKQMKEIGAGRLISYYGSIYNMLTRNYPTYEWNIFKFKHKPRNQLRKLENQREFIEYVLSEKGYTDLPGDLYKLSYKDIKEHGGVSLFHYHKRSLPDILQCIYPEYKLEKHLFSYAHLDTLDLQRKRMNIVAKKLQIKEPSDWSNVSYSDIIKANGTQVINNFNSISCALEALYPEQDWTQIYRRTKRQAGFWLSRKNQRDFMDSKMKEFGLTSPNEWKDVSSKDFISKFQGHNLLRLFDSYYDMIKTIYPEITANPFEFSSIPKKWTERKEFHRLYMEHLRTTLSLSSYEDFYNVNVREFGGRKLLQAYDGSYYKLLCSVFPDYKWDETRIPSRSSWASVEFQRIYLEKLREKLRIEKISDWLLVSVNDIRSSIRPVLSKYSSYHHMLQSVYPEVHWDPLERKQVPETFWKSKENVERFLEKLSLEYSIETPEDWSRISRKQIIACGGAGLLGEYGNLVSALKDIYPEIAWGKYDFKRNKRSEQRFLFLQLQKLFPNEEILEEYSCSQLQRSSGSFIELDIYIPSKNIAFEYHGEHHYKDIPAFGSLELYRIRDQEKLALCKDNNIRLVVIPYWCDLSISAIQSIINKNNASTTQ